MWSRSKNIALWVFQNIYFELSVVVVLLKNIIFEVNSARSNISDIFF